MHYFSSSSIDGNESVSRISGIWIPSPVDSLLRGVLNEDEIRAQNIIRDRHKMPFCALTV
jgi:hypothetical protein